MYTDTQARAALVVAQIEHDKRKYPSFPPDEIAQIARGKVRKLRTSNGITCAIVDLLTYKGHAATRVSSAGRKIKGKGGKEIFIKSTTRKGSADISATVWGGRSLQIEVKNEYTKDNKRGLSEAQEKEKDRQERAGALWLTCTSFTHFYNWYMQLELDQLKKA